MHTLLKLIIENPNFNSEGLIEINSQSTKIPKFKGDKNRAKEG